MVQTVVALMVVTAGSLWFTARRPGVKPRTRATVELLKPQFYVVLLVLMMILVLIWR
jgi:hypothetical protein